MDYYCLYLELHIYGVRSSQVSVVTRAVVAQVFAGCSVRDRNIWWNQNLLSS